MSDWGVLELEGDPTPGNPDAVRAVAARLRERAELAESNTTRLRAIAGGGGDLRMTGDYAARFTEALVELPDELAKLARAYRGCGEALSIYSTGLAEAKTRAGGALRDGVDADGRYQAALREVRALLPPDREVLLWPRAELSDGSIGSVTAGWEAQDLAGQVRAAANRGQVASADRARARRLAQDAAELRGQVAHTCARDIEQALSGSGIKNRPWYEKVWNAVSAPFRSWDSFVDLCRDVAMVAGVVAMFISGPIGLALVAIALVAGAVAFSDTLVKVAQGKASLGQLALDALGLIPGGRGVVSVARLGRTAAALGRGLARGEGVKLVGAGLRTLGGTALRQVRTATAYGMKVAGSVRETLQSGYQFTKTAASRFLKLDPVDMASGQMILQQVDLELPGLLAWTLQRTHMSSYQAGRWFGPSWSSTLDHRLEIDDAGVCYAAPDGVLLAYPHPAPGETVLPAEGPRLPLTRDENGAYTVTDSVTGHTLHFAVPADGARGVALPLAAISDRNGHRVELGYDADDGTLAEINHSGGYQLVVETRQGLIAAVRMRGRAWELDTEIIRYGYDASGRLTEVVNSSGRPLRFDYDEDGRIVRWLDRNGTQHVYTYDEAGRVVRTAGSAGCFDGTITYDTDRHVTVVTDSLGHVTEYHFNDTMQLQRQVDPLGHATSYEWDRYDRKLAETDPLGRTVRYSYDAAGNLVEVLRPDGSRASAEWNNLRLPVTLVEPDGARWERFYDDRGNLTAVVDPAGARTAFGHDDRGRLTTVTDALGHTRRVATDASGLPVAVTDPLGAVTSYDRDVFGRVVAVTDPVGGVTRFGWTVEGKIASRALPGGAVERWTYDGEGNLVEHVDAAGLVTRSEATHFDLPAARTGPDGARLAFAYDTELRLVAVTNPQGLVWRYDYDPAGNLVRETDFNGRVLAYGYDAAGQLVERTNGAGETVRFVRDVLGNVTEKHAASGVTTFAYDAAGRVVRATNADADCTLQRDALGRVLAETCNGRTVASTYDALGRRVRRVTPSGAESVWDYDPNDLPSSLRTAGRTVRFAHDEAGREVERSLDTGVVLAQAWDVNHRLLSQTVTAGGSVTARAGEPGTARQARLLQRRDYSYSPDGYVTEIDDMLAGLRRFDLDPARRVTAVHGTNWSERYAYDAAGNITDASWPAPAQRDGRDGRDGVHEAAQGGREYAGTLIRRAGSVRYEHDGQGRVTLRQQKRLSAKPRTWRYTWDADDRLTGVTTPDGRRWRYRYDPFGRRIAKQRFADNGTGGGSGDDGGVAERVDFAWDGVVLAEQHHLTGNAPAARVTAWDWEPGGFRPLTQSERRPSGDGTGAASNGATGDAAGNADHAVDDRAGRSVGEGPDDAEQGWFDARFHAIVTDLVGTPTELVDSDGDLAWRTRTTLWGASPPAADGDIDCPLRFPGQYHDPETGLNYNYHRYYAPESGRYDSNDPLGLA
ncbi:DUF6531 domain-containing protein, partial [Protofrankia symbiont of Coriaria ruscifolia]|uniref:DUF6531 domain-containing protein n=1 Tax=Protofrankia symbiont of Coriaria ruscifolia TaxID=1306542 RepID=UPI0010412D63